MASILKAARAARGLVDRRELEARERARGILAEAEAEAGRVREAAAAERTGMRAEAEWAGREEGLARAAVELAGAAEAREARLVDLEGEVVAAALEVARAVLGQEVAARPEVVVELARRSLERVRGRREILVRACPADAERLARERGRLSGLLERTRAIEVRADPTVSPGGVVVETEAGRVDARIEAQLAIVERILAEEE